MIERSTSDDRRTARRLDAVPSRRILRFAAALALAAASAAAQEQPPRFQSSVEVTSLDVTVVDDRGQPIPDLTPADFVVRIDGKARRVVSAEWVPLARTPRRPPAFVPAATARTRARPAAG